MSPSIRCRWLAVLGLLAACASPAPTAAVHDAAGADATADTAAPTSYAVGVLSMEATGAAGRTLPITLWYPAAPGGQGEPAKYFLGLAASPAGALMNVPPAQGPFPLVVFSHGHQAVRDQSFFLMEALAAHGYVVIAPDHAGNTLPDFDATLFDLDTMTFGAMFLYRPRDISATIDRILQPQPADPPWLAGLVDPTRIGMMGHSFGAWTTLAVAGAQVAPVSGMPDCATPTNAADPICKAIVELKLGPPPWNFGDPRIKVAVPLAHCFGAHFTADSLAKLKLPILLQAATADAICNYQKEALPMQAALGSPHALLTIDGGTHMSWSNLCNLPASMSSTVAANCGPTATPPDAVSHPVIAKYVLDAFDLYLRGKQPEPADFLSGTLPGLPFEMANKGFTK